jgi:hypothetical protein
LRIMFGWTGTGTIDSAHQVRKKPPFHKGGKQVKGI